MQRFPNLAVGRLIESNPLALWVGVVLPAIRHTVTRDTLAREVINSRQKSPKKRLPLLTMPARKTRRRESEEEIASKPDAVVDKKLKTDGGSNSFRVTIEHW